MGKLILNGRRFAMTDEALYELQQTLANAWEHSPVPGLWLTLTGDDAPDLRTWVSPTHQIDLIFDGDALGGPAPAIHTGGIDSEFREMFDP